ncbi:hypothetical protein V8E54_008929 [Elaphomyces granulatus]
MNPRTPTTAKNTKMNNPSPEQQLAWGGTLASEIPAWPRLQQLAETVGITANPTDILPIIRTAHGTQTGSLAAFLTMIETAMSHEANQADADDLVWRTKVATLQAKINDLTDALTRSVGGGSGLVQRISEDPERFGGTEKDVAKRQQQYITWRSHIQRCFSMDDQAITQLRGEERERCEVRPPKTSIPERNVQPAWSRYDAAIHATPPKAHDPVPTAYLAIWPSPALTVLPTKPLQPSPRD